MPSRHSVSRNWFDHGGGAYARFRPTYPAQLAAFLASVTPDVRLAADVGCGNGQLAQLLAHHFDAVIALDPSADQLAHATANARVSYQCARAEHLPLAGRSASLIAAAQAAHWFDLPAFYGEVRRVAVAGGILALISYGVLRVESDLNERFQQFYRAEMGVYWPAERKLVDTGYASIDFPFEEIQAPPMEIRREWRLAEFLGYIGTWSTVRNAQGAGREDLLLAFARDLADAWGDAASARAITWPINMRIGKI